MIDILKSNFIKFKDLSLKNKLMILIPFFAILIISIIRALKVNQISDFYVFYFAGKNFLNGNNLYFLKDQSRQFLYPPFAGLVFSFLFAFPFKISAIIWGISNVFLWLMNILISINIIEQELKNSISSKFIVLSVLFTFNFFIDNLNLLQVNSLNLLFILLAFYYYQKEKFVFTALLLALAICIKVTPIIFILWMLVKNEWKLLFYSILFLIGFSILPLMFRGYSLYVFDITQFLSTLKYEIPDVNSGFQNYNTYSLRSLAINYSHFFGLSNDILKLMMAAIPFSFLIFYIGFLIYTKIKRNSSLTIEIAITLVFILLFSAVTRKAHMLILIFPFLSILSLSNFMNIFDCRKVYYICIFTGTTFFITGRDIIGNKASEFLIYFHFFTFQMVLMFFLIMFITINRFKNIKINNLNSPIQT